MVSMAAIWGYVGDTISDKTANLFANFSISSLVPEISLGSSDKDDPSEPPTANNQLVNDFNSTSNSVPGVVQSNDPYAQLKQAGPPPNSGTLRNTLDSITQGQIADQQVQKRNLYFERLSSQLKELQGEAPPINPGYPSSETAPTNAPGNEVTSNDTSDRLEDDVANDLHSPDAIARQRLQSQGAVPALDAQLMDIPLEQPYVEPELSDEEIDLILDGY